MKRNLTSFLQSIFNEKLKENRFSWVLAKYLTHEHLNKSKRDLFEEIRNFYENTLNQELHTFDLIDETQERSANKDYRIKSIRASSVRGIPQKKNNHPFGIDLSDSDDNPIIALIVGSNGSGKSSIYNSLEYIYANEIGESKLRGGATDKDFTEYLTHYNSRFSDASCTINTISGEFSLSNPIFKKGSEIKDLINPSSHFISEYDIYFNGQLDYEGNNDNSFHYFVAQSLGLDAFLRLKHKLNEIAEYINRRRIETDELESKISNLKTFEENITLWKEQLIHKEREINSLENSEIQPKNKPTNIITKSLIDDALTVFDDTSINTETIESARKLFLDRFKEYKEVVPGKEDTDFIGFLNIGFEIIERQNLDNCPFCNDSKKDISDLKKEINQKLKQFERENNIISSTEEAYDNFILTVSTTLNILNGIREKINSDISSISFISELSNVIGSAKNLEVELVSLLNSEFVEYFYELSLSRIKREQRYKQVEDLILKYSKDFYSRIKILAEDFEKFRTARIQSLEHIKTSIEDEVEESGENKISLLNSEISDLNDLINNTESNIKELKKEIENLNKIIKLNKTIKNEATSVNEVIAKEINQEVQDVFDPLKTTIEEILNDYLEDNHTLEIQKNNTIEEGMVLTAVISKKEPDGSFIKISAGKFFNSFRYKLFCTLVSCSIAISSRKNSKINLPLVLDDIFYSSDFETKTTVASFLQKIIILTKRYTPEMPLQLIFLTHDELIFDLARKAINEFETYKETSIFNKENKIIFWNKDLSENSKFFRLFPPSDLGSKPISSKFGVFWNLVYEIPNRYTSKSMKIEQ